MLHDLRLALRTFRKTPGFVFIVVATLALCIGANSAIFSVVHSILLKPYPWPDSDRLVYVYNSYPLMGLVNAGVSIPDYLDRRTQMSGFADSAMYTSQSFNLASDGEPERIIGLRATPSLFTTLQTGAALGRCFTEAEAQPGSDQVIVLSHTLWRNRFGSNPAILGTTLRLNTETYTVIGVMPEGFYFPTPRVQAWVPFAIKPDERTDQERGNEYSTSIARLKPGATLPAVQRDLDIVQARNAERLTDSRVFYQTSGFGGRVNGFLEQNVSNIRSMLWLVQAGVAVALLIGCANVASLLLARAVGRERELAIRAALGASRGRLLRLLFAESLLLFLTGSVLGVLVAHGGVKLLGTLGLGTLPRAFAVSLDTSVVAFTLLCALVTGLGFGALPAWTSSRGDAGAALKEAGTRGSAGRRTSTLRATLVVGEIALAVMLLSTAGLLVRSFMRLQQENPGFSPLGVLTAQLTLPGARYGQPARVGFADAVLSRVRALPGVQSAGLTTILPFTGNNSQSSYESPDIVLPAGTPSPHAQVRSVDPGYFGALGLTLLRGRLFTGADNESSQKVCVIDRVLADRYWPGEDPIGKQIRHGEHEGKPDIWLIVGMVAPIKFESLEDDVKKETIYFPYAQSPSTSMVLVIRTQGDLSALAASVRAAVRTVDPEQPVFDLKTMQQRMDDVALARRAPMVLLILFGGVALLLAMLGVYGVLSFSIAQRTTEFGVRMALGATIGNIASLVLFQGGRLVGLGLLSGLAGYLALSSLVGKLLYKVAPTDPVALFPVPVLLSLAALVSVLLPLRRAVRVNPIEAIRAE